MDGRAGASGPPPLGLGTRLLYGLGSAAYGVKDAAFRTFLLLYYNQVVGVPADLVSAAILVALVVDAFSDPVVGQWSDSLRTRWGRRHPLIYASAIPAALAFVFLFRPPPGLSDTMMFLYILGVSVAVRTLITFYEIPSSALAPELSPDYDDRTRIASFRYFFGIAGGLGMAFAGLFIFLAPTPDHPVGQLNPEGYRTFAVTGAIVMAGSILLSALGTHHRIPWLTKGSAAPWGGLAGHLRQMRAAYAHKGFHAILGFGLLKFTMIGLASAAASSPSSRSTGSSPPWPPSGLHPGSRSGSARGTGPFSSPSASSCSARSPSCSPSPGCSRRSAARGWCRPSSSSSSSIRSQAPPRWCWSTP